MADIRTVRDMNGLIAYFSENLGWEIDLNSFDDIEDISYEFDAHDIGLKDEAFAKIASMRQLQPMVNDQQWGIFCIEFESHKFEPTALRKVLSGLVPRRRASVDHAMWQQQDLLFICNWGEGNNRTIGLAHFEDKEKGLPQIKMISCDPSVEDFTQIKQFEDSLKQLSWPRDPANMQAWRDQWSNAFSVAYREVIQTSSMLTIRLAAEAQNIRNLVLDVLKVENEQGYVHKLYEKFRQALIHDMTETAFADMYAQTVVYGLFSARCMDTTQEDFSVREAVTCIPNTNPFLRELMKECLGADSRDGDFMGADKRLYASFDELDIGNVVDLLAHTNTEAIIRDFNRQTGGGKEDPIIHFYEEFLTAYDKQQKVQRGVFYTPQPVVSFMVRAVDDILKKEFGYEDGLASIETKSVEITRKSKKKNDRGFYYDMKDAEEVPAVQVLDPATGTGTFLRQVILQIYENFKAKHAGESDAAIKAAWNEYVPKHLLPRINGFELMMAPYAVAHMKLAMVLHDTGYEFGTDARLNVCLTNTLEPPGDADDQISFFNDPLAMESIEANKVKKNKGISVVLGNPPYAGASSNKGQHITDLIEVYKKEPGGKTKLQERNAKWLNDDYVKFIRYAQNHASENEQYIVAYINPHGFIDAPTFRGMRWALLQEFDEMYIINLHGNANRGETSPDGSADENVFDILQGVSINILIHNKRRKQHSIKYFDIFGQRNKKYEFLYNQSLSSIEWNTVSPVEPMFFLSPRNDDKLHEYQSGIKLSDLFVNSVMGFQTHRDKFAVAFTKQEMEKRCRDLMDESLSAEDILTKYSLKESSDWSVASSRARLKTVDTETILCECLYRPFDIRYCYLDNSFMDRERRELVDNVLHRDNLCLLVSRQQAKPGFRHVFITKLPANDCVLSTASREGNQIFPLYYFALSGDMKQSGAKRSNLNRKAVQILLSDTHMAEIDYSDEQIIYYIYAILYSDKYRKQYSEFTQSDFPYICKPLSAEQFNALSEFGKQLVDAHLLLGSTASGHCLQGEGNSVIQAVEYRENRVYINDNQFFDDVSDNVWNYQIGGHLPAQLWLKQRKGLKLTNSDISHYCNIIQAIIETLSLVNRIDDIVELDDEEAENRECT